MPFFEDYLKTVDELPHHFQLHFLHAAEILGYKHPIPWIAAWWNLCYLKLVKDMHLQPETKEQMMKRLGDSEKDWRAAEVVTAAGPAGHPMEGLKGDELIAAHFDRMS